MPVKMDGYVSGSSKRGNILRKWKDKIDPQTGKAHLTVVFADDMIARRSRTFVPAVVEVEREGVKTLKLGYHIHTTSEDPDHEREYVFDKKTWKPQRDPLWRLLLWLARARHGLDGQAEAWFVKNPNPKGKSRSLTLFDITGQTEGRWAFKDSFVPGAEFVFSVIDLDEPEKGIVRWDERIACGEDLVEKLNEWKHAGHKVFSEPVPVQVTYDPDAGGFSDRYSYIISNREVPQEALDAYRNDTRPNLCWREIPSDPDELRRVVEAHLATNVREDIPEKIWNRIWDQTEAIKRIRAEREAAARRADGEVDEPEPEPEREPAECGETTEMQRETAILNTEEAEAEARMATPSSWSCRNCGEAVSFRDDPDFVQCACGWEYAPCPNCRNLLGNPAGAAFVECGNPDCGKRFDLEPEAPPENGPDAPPQAGGDDGFDGPEIAEGEEF